MWWLRTRRAWLRFATTRRGLGELAATADLLAEFELRFPIAGFDARESGLTHPSPDGNTSAWVSNQVDDTVWELDPIGDRVARRIPVGHLPTGIALGDGAVWVANSGDGTVSRIDPASGRVVDTIEVGGSPQSIEVGEGGVWVTVYPTEVTAPEGTTPISLKTAWPSGSRPSARSRSPAPTGARSPPRTMRRRRCSARRAQ